MITFHLLECDRRPGCNCPEAEVDEHGNRPLVTEQRPPTATSGIAVWDLVIADMQARDRLGRERYGTPLQLFNGRDALVDAYQEALDLVVYLRQAIEERDEMRRAFGH